MSLDAYDESFMYNITRFSLCKLGKVVGTQELEDGFVDVQLLINKMYQDGTTEEYDTLHRVPVVPISTSTSSITLPINQDDPCLVVFTDFDPTDFLLGNTEPHDPPSFSLFDNHHAFCIVGINSMQSSPYNRNNYTNQLETTSLNIVHNKKTSNEVVFSLNQDGTIKCISPSPVNIEAPEVNANSAIVKTDGDVIVKGLSVYNHMTQHKHPYTDDGKPMVTEIPLPL